MKIKALTARAISNSLGHLTVEALLKTERGRFRASVPAGISVGKYEARTAPVPEAVSYIRGTIASQLLGKNIESQTQVDQILIGLAGPNKAGLGVNAVLPVSIACCRALAVEQDLSLYKFISQSQNINISKYLLPRPCVLLIEGGKHGKGGLSAQEFMAVPLPPTSPTTFSEDYKRAVKVYGALKEILKQKFGSRGVQTGLEGGFAPILQKTREALDLIMQAIKAAGLEGEVALGLDIAATHFWENGNYHFEGKGKTSEGLLAFYQGLISSYPILFLEDPFSEDDIASWRLLKLKIKNQKLKIIGDDLTVTNPQRIKYAQENDLCDGVIVKPNQIGTVSEAIEAVKLAKGFGWKTIVSHRAGDTQDDFIADFATGCGADFIKAGGPFQPERQAKYNRLLAIEKEL